MHPPGHTRVPKYVRGHSGTVLHVAPPFKFHDASAHDLRRRNECTYHVAFESSELWSESAEVEDTVVVDLWETYLPGTLVLRTNSSLDLIPGCFKCAAPVLVQPSHIGTDMSASRRIMTLGLVVIALALLYPGVSQPILTLSGTIEKSRLAELGVEIVAGPDTDSQTRQMLTAISSFLGFDQIEGQLLVYTSTRSIWGTVESLAASGNVLVALLIIFFSLVLPTFKLLLQAMSLFISRAEFRRPLLSLNAALSKWSMADVFVMGLLVAFLAGSSADQTGDILAMHASLGAGFYYFLAYCLFSVMAGSILQKSPPSEVGDN